MSDRAPAKLPRRAAFEPLERRALLAAAPWAGPSAREQQMLELINRFRQDPADELPFLINSTDSNVQAALAFFQVDRTELADQWAQLSPAAPLAWNAALSESSYLHNLRQIKYDRQSHKLPGETDLVVRTALAGYDDAQFVGENTYAFMHNVEHAHAGFAVDWGPTPNGIQDPAGHRDNLMAGVYREVGLSITDTLAGKTVGPLLVTQNFGVRNDQTDPFLLGVIYTDVDGDGAYSPGEGAAGATVIATGAAGTFTTTTMSAGGYQMDLPPGVYAMTVAGGGMRGVARLNSVTVGIDNVKRDFTAPNFVPSSDVTPPDATLATSDPAAGASSHVFTVTYTDDTAVATTSISHGDVRVTGPNGYSVAAQLLVVNQQSDGVARTATYRITAPGWSFDGADNGTYTVSSVADEVTDTAGNALPAQALGTFTVNLPTVFLSPAGLLGVAGTAGHDSISLAITSSRTRSFVQVNVNGNVQYFAYRGVGRIQVQGLAGNDTITLDRRLMGASIDAGAGHDVVHGTNGSDYIIGGDGDDILYAYNGRDFITAGPGYDRVFRDGRATIEGVEKLLRAAP
ncbi:MAG: hypothetical protein ACAI43_08650 [Phycisphaerae bacterium]|nr:hypothetical protein [Tepidisphaeraceae bacterium]